MILSIELIYMNSYIKYQSEITIILLCKKWEIHLLIFFPFIVIGGGGGGPSPSYGTGTTDHNKRQTTEKHFIRKLNVLVLTKQIITWMGAMLSCVTSIYTAWAIHGTSGWRAEGCMNAPTGSPPYRYTSRPCSCASCADIASEREWNKIGCSYATRIYLDNKPYTEAIKYSLFYQLENQWLGNWKYS